MDEWELIYNATPCYFFSFSNSGIVTRINTTLLDDLGYQAEEVVNIFRLEELLTIGSRIFFQTHFYPLIKMQGKANEIYLSFRAKDKRELPVLLNVTLQKKDDSFEIHCGGMQITQRNRFEKELLEAKNIAEKALLENDELVQLKRQLEYNQQQLEKQLKKMSRINNEHYQIDKVLSHDLQEPLRKISIFTSMVLEKAGADWQQLDRIEKIGTAVDKIRRLIDSMQKFHSLEYKEFKYSKIAIPSIVEIAARKAEVLPELNFQDSFPELYADSDLLVSLFQELLTNSAKFIDNGVTPKIAITADTVMQNIFSEINNRYSYEEFVRISYTDNGQGFDNKYAEQTFNLFNKLHPNGGLGIGLAYCKKIVHLHLGTITVSSKAGSGSTFTILLPARPQDIVTENYTN